MSAATANPQLERRRTGGDVALGLLTVAVGVFMLGHVVLTGVVSILLLGWLMIIGGITVAVSSVVSWSAPGHWWGLVGGGLLLVLGLGFVRNPGASLAVLTLLAGSMLTVGGVARIAAGFQPGAPRAALMFSGGLTLLLGLLVMFGWPVSAAWYLGTVLGVQMVLDGVTTAISGRVRPTSNPVAA
jgi:uncharacterized membrane protein HdeD (DUF308 family)